MPSATVMIQAPVENAFEDIASGYGRQYTKTYREAVLDKFFPKTEVTKPDGTKEKVDSITRDAAEGALMQFEGMVINGIIIYIEQKFIGGLFDKADEFRKKHWGDLKDYWTNRKTKAKTLKGVRLANSMKQHRDDTAVYTRDLAIQAEVANKLKSRELQQNSVQPLAAVTTQKDYMKAEKDRAMTAAAAHAASLGPAFLMKVMTKSFSPADEKTIKKFFNSVDSNGKVSTPQTINYEDLNNLTDIMYFKNSDGEYLTLPRFMAELAAGRRITAGGVV